MSAGGTHPGDVHAAKLIRMANGIAAFFRPFPHERAVAGVQEHIASFWSPVMRRDLRGVLDAAGLDPLVVAAMRRPADAPSPVERETAGPAEAGQLGATDAG